MNILIRSGSRLTTPVVITFTESAIGRRAAAAVCLEIEISFRYPICSGRISHWTSPRRLMLNAIYFCAMQSHSSAKARWDMATWDAVKMEGLQDSNAVHFYPETRLKSVESSSNPVGPSCPTTMQSRRPDSCNNGQGHRINFVKWPITTMPLACPRLFAPYFLSSVQERRGAHAHFSFVRSSEVHDQS